MPEVFVRYSKNGEKIVTKYWSMQINMLLVTINIFDTYRAYSQANGDTDPQVRLYIEFSEELIDNSHNVIGKLLGRSNTTYGTIVLCFSGRLLSMQGREYLHIQPLQRRKVNERMGR